MEISVIMPVYNAGKYLGEALGSILKQTYQDFEVICINDASADETMKILLQFHNADGRVRILENTEHSGAAVSRNRGMLEARGKYITFLDGDDIFEEEMLESAYKVIKRHNADIVMYEYMHVSSEHIYEKRSIPRSEQFIEKYCNMPFSIQEHEPIEFINWTDSPCNKLYRKDFIFSNRLEFQTLLSANDVYFVNMALLLAEKVIMLRDRRVMVYARDHYEPTRISYDRKPMCMYKAMEKLGKELIARGIFGDVFQYYFFRLFYALRAALIRSKNREDAEQFYCFLQDGGLNNLIGFSKEYYQEVDGYICNLLENFRKLDFSTGWYRQEHAIAYYLSRNVEKIVSLFRSFEDRGEKAAWWGVGVKGKACLNFLQQHGLRVAAVVDRDGNKIGEMINGYVIRKPEDILAEVQIVMVCTLTVYKDVSAELYDTEISVINIEDYCMDI